MAESLESIDANSCDQSWEVICADGGSSDNTRDIASEWGAYVLPGGDSGIYEGMNRGLKAASGEFVLFLNADDRLAPGALPAFQEIIQKTPSIDMVTGEAVIRSGETAKLYRPSGLLNAESAIFGVPVINARLMRRETLLSVGGYNEEIGLAADRLLLLNLAVSDIVTALLPFPVYEYRVHPGSKTLAEDEGSTKRILAAEGTFTQALQQLDNLTRLSRAHKALHQIRTIRQTRKFSVFPIISGMHGLWLWRKWRGKMAGY